MSLFPNTSMPAQKKYLRLNDLNSYKISFHLSNYVWDIIVKWDRIARNTVGEQFIRSTDSISANIAEGFGRRTKKDKIKFFNYSYASTFESLDWNEKSKSRKLITKAQYDHIFTELQKLPREIHHLSDFVNRKLKK